MLLCGSRSKLKPESLNVVMNDTVIECVCEMKYLGVIIDRHLSFNSHINKLCGKISAKMGLLWRIRNFIDGNLAKMLYNSLIFPHFLYCNFILDGMNKANKHKLQVQQNNAFGAVLKADFDTLTVKLYADAGVDNVEVCMKKTVCKIVYRGIYDLGPPFYNTLFNLATSPRDLRSSNMLNAVILIGRSKFGEYNVAFQGPTYWNQVHTPIQFTWAI